jgi:Protein of unknown function (DUF3429)
LLSNVPSAIDSSLRVPPPAAWLGGFGLLPFIAGAALVVSSDVTWALYALRFYAAAILSFMGGVHWGLAIANFGPGTGSGSSWTRLCGSVLPALIAWLGLLLAPVPGLLVTAAAFTILLLGDLFAVRMGMAPRWYPRLRLPLTSVVVVCLITAAVG